MASAFVYGSGQHFNQKPSDAAFPNFDNCRPKVAGDVISGAALDSVSTLGMDDAAKLGDSRLISGRIIRLFVRPDRFTHFCSI